jgi:spore coat protein CotF
MDKKEKEMWKNDQVIFTELLYLEEYLTIQYNEALYHSSNLQMRQEFLQLLLDEHQLTSEIFDEMSKRGWLSSDTADYERIKELKQKFSEIFSQM